MSRSWGHSADMRYRDWGRARKERALVQDWKNQLQEEEEVSGINAVFIIINEWVDDRDNTSSEVVGNKFFLTEDEAWYALDLIAESHHVGLSHDDTSFTLGGDGNGLQSEEFRIEKLTREGE